VHLHVRSAFSFLWGTFTPEELVLRAKKAGHSAVALTDLNGLYGAVRFYRAARKAGIKAVIGSEVTLRGGHTVVLLARNRRGYENLSRLLTRAHLENERGAPELRFEHLFQFNEGLICLVGGRNSRLRKLFEQGKTSEAEAFLRRFKEAFSEEGNLFVIIQNHFLEKDQMVLERAYELSRKLSLPVVATNEVTFLSPEDYETHRALVGIARVFHHRKVKPLPNDAFYFTTAEEMMERVPYPEALENSVAIAAECSFQFELGRPKPPRIFKSQREAEERLSKICLLELARRKKPVPLSYLRRLDKELSLIKARKLSDFFLLVKEVRDFARRRDIRCTVRGSAASSLVIHLLLGGVDPVEHGLLFERFLNDGRADLPDVDLDFDSDRRDEVLSYVMEKFSGRAAMVCTILTFRVRGAVRMLGRALGYSYEEITRLSRGLPSAFRGVDILTALSRFPELRGHPILQEERLLSLAARVAGLPFRHSVHLGGVVIAPDEIETVSPVEISARGLPVIQFDKDDVDALGLLKLDLLGLRMHTAIRKSLEALKRQGIELNPDDIPLDDEKTYRLLQKGDTLGVFQLESPGQRQLVVRLKPCRFSDVIAEISLFRPGPVEGDMVNPYVRRRNGETRVIYPHPDLESILKETYGVILFQEQVLEIAHRFAGMSYAEADAFRRAMTKDRSPEEMAKIKDRFVSGARRKGYSPEVAERVFEMVASFAAYGFCKAHAASFAHITFQSAYLKAHHPREFYIGLLNAGHVGSYPPFVILNEARRRGIPVYPPHVNTSGLEYLPEGEGIRVPLTEVKSVGPETARKIVEEREIRGPYTGLRDFLKRIPVSRRVLEMLLLSGALEGLDEGERKAA